MLAEPGTKFIVVFTLPSGKQMAGGGRDGKFALVEIPKTGMMNGILAWDDSKEVGAWIKSFRAKVGQVEWEKWWIMRPALGRVRLSN